MKGVIKMEDLNNVSKVSTETDYNLVKQLAAKYGIKFVGVKKTVVLDQVNQKLEEEKGMENKEMVAGQEEVVAVVENVVSEEGIEKEVVAVVAAEETEASEEVVEVTEDTEVPVEAVVEAVATPKAGKWYEQEGTSYTFEEGQKIFITGGYQPLIGRYAEITGPSKKRDAVKARLYKPNKPSELQGTLVTFNIGEFELFEGEVPVIETKKKKTEAENEIESAVAEVAASTETEQTAV